MILRWFCARVDFMILLLRTVNLGIAIVKHAVLITLAFTAELACANADTDICTPHATFLQNTIQPLVESGEAGKLQRPADILAQLMSQETQLLQACTPQQRDAIFVTQQQLALQTETQSFHRGWLRFYQAEYRCARRDVASNDFIYCAEQKRQFRELFEWLWQHQSHE